MNTYIRKLTRSFYGRSRRCRVKRNRVQCIGTAVSIAISIDFKSERPALRTTSLRCAPSESRIWNARLQKGAPEKRPEKDASERRTLRRANLKGAPRKGESERRLSERRSCKARLQKGSSGRRALRVRANLKSARFWKANVKDESKRRPFEKPMWKARHQQEQRDRRTFRQANLRGAPSERIWKVRLLKSLCERPRWKEHLRKPNVEGAPSARAASTSEPSFLKRIWRRPRSIWIDVEWLLCVVVCFCVFLKAFYNLPRLKLNINIDRALDIGPRYTYIYI